MQNLQFPLQFHFKIGTISNDFVARDAAGKVVAYVKQKLFKLKEEITIYADESKTKELYKIRADRWLDFSAAYTFYNEGGNDFGKIVRKGWRSLWKTNYDLIDEHSKVQYHIKEENAWVKVVDSVFGQIPILGMFTGYVFNPTYVVTDKLESVVVRLKKKPTFLGLDFIIEKVGRIDSDDDDRIMLGLMMMILLERKKG